MDNRLLGPLGLVQRRKGNAARRLTYHELASFSLVPVGEKSPKVAPFSGGEALVSFLVLTTVPLPSAVALPRRMHVSSRGSVITSFSGTAPSSFCWQLLPKPESLLDRCRIHTGLLPCMPHPVHLKHSCTPTHKMSQKQVYPKVAAATTTKAVNHPLSLSQDFLRINQTSDDNSL